LPITSVYHRGAIFLSFISVSRLTILVLTSILISVGQPASSSATALSFSKDQGPKFHSFVFLSFIFTFEVESKYL